ncbi:MAG: hypothetical protein WBP64_22070 [Nitrososphaeraceae archaeon]
MQKDVGKKIHLSSAIDNDQNNTVDNESHNVDALQTFSKTCSLMYGKINKKQFEYLQAITSLQEDMLGSCNGLVKNQVDLIEEYSKHGIVTKEQIIPVIEAANKIVESYLNYLSFEYDLVLARIGLHHKILTMINDSSPKLTQLYMEWLKLFKI